jgi:hypothetical protein
VAPAASRLLLPWPLKEAVQTARDGTWPTVMWGRLSRRRRARGGRRAKPAMRGSPTGAVGTARRQLGGHRSLLSSASRRPRSNRACKNISQFAGWDHLKGTPVPRDALPEQPSREQHTGASLEAASTADQHSLTGLAVEGRGHRSETCRPSAADPRVRTVSFWTANVVLAPPRGSTSLPRRNRSRASGPGGFVNLKPTGKAEPFWMEKAVPALSRP